MSKLSYVRLQEGALKALKTPTAPPAQPKLIPLSPAPKDKP
jgi:hypothetical protein